MDNIQLSNGYFALIAKGDLLKFNDVLSKYSITEEELIKIMRTGALVTRIRFCDAEYYRRKELELYMANTSEE